MDLHTLKLMFEQMNETLQKLLMQQKEKTNGHNNFERRDHKYLKNELK